MFHKKTALTPKWKKECKKSFLVLLAWIIAIKEIEFQCAALQSQQPIARASLFPKLYNHYSEVQIFYSDVYFLHMGPCVTLLCLVAGRGLWIN